VDTYVPAVQEASVQVAPTRQRYVLVRLGLGMIMTRDDNWFNAGKERWDSFRVEHRADDVPVLLYALRHGTTQLNEDNKFRGWVNVTLDASGQKDARVAGAFLQDRGIKAIYCSDLERAVETAKIVGEIINCDPTEDKLLRGWNIGELSGEDKSTHQEELEFYVDHPKTPIPGGESLLQFSTREQNAFDKYFEIARRNGPILLIFHTSNVIQLENYCASASSTRRPESDEAVLPGGIISVKEVGDKLLTEAILKDSGKAEYGS